MQITRAWGPLLWAYSLILVSGLMLVSNVHSHLPAHVLIQGFHCFAALLQKTIFSRISTFLYIFFIIMRLWWPCFYHIYLQVLLGGRPLFCLFSHICLIDITLLWLPCSHHIFLRGGSTFCYFCLYLFWYCSSVTALCLTYIFTQFQLWVQGNNTNLFPLSTLVSNQVEYPFISHILVIQAS